jgi:DNA recombination protein RmuC
MVLFRSGLTPRYAMDPVSIALIALGGACLVLGIVGALVLRKAWGEADGLRAQFSGAQSALSEAQLELREAQTEARRVDELKAELASERAMRDAAEKALAEARNHRVPRGRAGRAA